MVTKEHIGRRILCRVAGWENRNRHAVDRMIIDRGGLQQSCVVSLSDNLQQCCLGGDTGHFDVQTLWVPCEEVEVVEVIGPADWSDRDFAAERFGVKK